MSLVRISRALTREVRDLTFGPPVAYVYNPLDYARRPHEAYLKRYGESTKEALLLGMNPGPFGMAQTGVPFGDVALVRDWLGISGTVEKPPAEHPKRPVLGFDCPRSEVSGTRLWSWARDRFGAADAFFARFFVWNYCPLAFLEDGGRNRTPDKLPASERDPLFEACDRALRAVVKHVDPTWVIGVGAFAEARARRVLPAESRRFGRVLHPSPASPRANQGWAAAMDEDLAALGLTPPRR